MTKTWPIHLGWAMITLLTAVVSVRVASHQGDEIPQVFRVLPATAAREMTLTSTGERNEKTALKVGAANSPHTPVLPTSIDSIADRIRAHLRNSTDMTDAETLLEGVTDRQFKLALLKEGLFSKNQGAFSLCVNLLGQMKGRDAAEVLEAYLTTHRDQREAGYAAINLGDIGDTGSMPALIEALQSKVLEVRLWSAEALLKMGYAAPAEQLIADMSRQFESPDGAVRKKTIYTLTGLTMEGTVPILTRALKDSNGDVRTAALQAFSNLENPKHIPLIEPLLKDPNSDVAQLAGEVLEDLRNH